MKENDCCVKAELAAIIRMNGVISTLEPHDMLDIQTESAGIARRIFTLLKRLTKLRLSIRKVFFLNWIPYCLSKEYSLISIYI